MPAMWMQRGRCTKLQAGKRLANDSVKPLVPGQVNSIARPATHKRAVSACQLFAGQRRCASGDCVPDLCPMHVQGQKTTNELAYDLNTTLLLLGAYGVFMMQGGQALAATQGVGHGRQLRSNASRAPEVHTCVARSGASRAYACQCMVARLCMQLFIAIAHMTASGL